MTLLIERIIKLKTDAALAARIAAFWEHQVKEHGEAKATAFYNTHFPHTHEQKGSVEWEGLTLSREPTAAEKICVKAVADAQESGKKKVYKVLSVVSAGLLAQAILGILKLKPAEYHTLILKLPKTAKPDLVSALEDIYLQGREQVAKEITTALGTAEEIVAGTEVPAAIESLAEATLSGIANDAAARVSSIATQAVTVGLDGAELRGRIEKGVEDLSDASVQRASAGAANVSLAKGRRDEGIDENPKGVWVWSSLLDSGTCTPCFEQDGEEYATLEEAPTQPYEDCLGMSLCRCFTVYVPEGG